MAETTTSTSTAQKSATTRKTNATKRSTAGKKAAETRAANRGSAARSTATRRAKSNASTTASRAETTAAKKAAEAKQELRNPISRATEFAEKAVLVPVGATLIARDRMISTLEGIRKTYSTRTKAEQELRRFERRGSSAVKRIERDVKKSRTRLERDLRQRRARLERELKSIEKELKTNPVVKNAEFMTARVENVMQSGRTAATQATTKVQERIASLA
jgi:hypothetical protein